jgi:hypothetical protein
MFTCEICHREKSDLERVAIGRWSSFVTGLVAQPRVSVVCQRCSGRVKTRGVVALVGLLVISIVTVVVLEFATDYF